MGRTRQNWNFGWQGSIYDKSNAFWTNLHPKGKGEGEPQGVLWIDHELETFATRVPAASGIDTCPQAILKFLCPSSLDYREPSTESRLTQLWLCIILRYQSQSRRSFLVSMAKFMKPILNECNVLSLQLHLRRIYFMNYCKILEILAVVFILWYHRLLIS